MKRVTIWACAMLLWFLAFSTIFSLWVERTMMPVVTECYPDTAESYSKPRLPLDCLFPGEDGTLVLYQTFDGLAWESGTRVKLADPASYTVLDEYIVYYGQEPVIQYSTKELRLGEKALADSKAECRKDLYLAIYPEEIRLRDDLREDITILAQSEGAALLEAEFPAVFMPKRSAGELFRQEDISLAKVYSLVDIENFFKGLPLAAFMPGVILFVLIIWILSLPLLKNPIRNRFRLILNSSFAILALIIVSVLLNFLQFPSSLLPKEIIVDVPYFIEEFREILPLLRSFASENTPVAQAILDLVEARIWGSAMVFALCAGLAGGWGLLCLRCGGRKKLFCL